MTCVQTSTGTTCYPPYAPMESASYGNIALGEDVLCGMTVLLIIAAGFGLGWLATDRFTTMLR
jgi:hypothetical protein